MNKFNGNRNSGGGNFGRRDFDRNDRERQMHQAVCSNCGKNCQVPFMPTGSKPVYCSSCFENNGNTSPRFENKGFGRPSFGERPSFGGGERRFDNRGGERNAPAPQQPQNTRQFDLINEKLDKILKLLASQPSVELDQAPAPEKKKAKKAKSSKKK